MGRNGKIIAKRFLINYEGFQELPVTNEYVTDGVDINIDGNASFSSAPNTTVAQTNFGIFEANTQYVINFTISNYVEGEVFIREPIISDYYSENGTYEAIIDIGILGKNSLNWRSQGVSTTLDITTNNIEKVIQQPNQRYIKDKGISPKYPLSLSGKGAEFNGTNQYIPIDNVTLTNDSYISFIISVPFGVNQIEKPILGGADRIMLRTDQNRIIADLRPVGGGASDVIIENIDYDTPMFIEIVSTLTETTTYLNGIQNQTLSRSLGGLVFTEVGASTNRSAYTQMMLKDLYIFSRVLTPTEITKAYQYPEQFYIDVKTGVVPNCVLNMPLTDWKNDGDSYRRDEVGYSEGSELVTGGDFNNPSDWTIPSSCEISGGKLVATNLLTSEEITQPISTTSGNIYLVSIDVDELTSGELQIGFSGGTSVYSENITSSGNHSFILVSNGNGLVKIRARTSSFNGSVDNISVKQLSGIYPIENYTNDCNADNIQYGSMSNLMVTDTFGRYLSKSPYLEGDGSSYGDTGYIFRDDTDWTVYTIIDYASLPSTNESIGTYSITTTKRFTIFHEQDDNLKVRIGTIITPNLGNPIGEAKFIAVKYRHSDNMFQVKINDVVVQDWTLTDFETAEFTFTLGKRNRGTNTINNYFMVNPTRDFKTKEVLTTDEEDTEAYSKAVKKGLLI
ncbi:MAG: LamG domain-containing protein [Firmicutes bacterium]|jgi:hypothetical protein|nr:LamG domain-containing protein [Bacillota bacterium]